MNKKSLLSTASIIAAAALVGGCQLINPRVARPGTSPTPTSSPEATVTPEPTTRPSDASPSANPKASPEISVRTPGAGTKGGQTKGGQTTGDVKGSTTTMPSTTTTSTSNLYDTSIDTIETTVNDYQSDNFDVKLSNKGNQKVQFAVKGDFQASSEYPVRINNSSNEATGEIEANSTSTFTIHVKGSRAYPNVATTVKVNFVKDGQVVTTRTIKVTVRTLVSDIVTLETNTDADKTGTPTMSVAYKPNYSYPIRIQNRHSRKVRWSAKITSTTLDGKAKVSIPSGEIEPNQYGYTALSFTDANLSSDVTLVHIEFWFSDDNGNTYTKTVEVKVNR